MWLIRNGMEAELAELRAAEESKSPPEEGQRRAGRRAASGT